MLDLTKLIESQNAVDEAIANSNSEYDAIWQEIKKIIDNKNLKERVQLIYCLTSNFNKDSDTNSEDIICLLESIESVFRNRGFYGRKVNIIDKNTLEFIDYDGMNHINSFIESFKENLEDGQVMTFIYDYDKKVFVGHNVIWNDDKQSEYDIMEDITESIHASIPY